MAMRAKKGEQRELPPPKSYIAALIGITDIGTQHGGNYGPSEQVIFTYELHGRRGPARNSRGEIFTCSQFLNRVSGASKPSPLAKTLAALTGKRITADEYDIDESLIDTPCRLTITHVEKKGTTRDNIESVAPLDEDDDEPEIQSNSWYYEIVPGGEIPDEVPKWLHAMIERSDEYSGETPPTKPKRQREDNGKPATAGKKRPARTAPAADADDDDDDDDNDQHDAAPATTPRAKTVDNTGAGKKPRRAEPAASRRAAAPPPETEDDDEDDDEDDIPF